MRIVRENTPLDYYRKLGEDCLRGYYLRHYPFDQDETLGIEKRVVFPLDDAGDLPHAGHHRPHLPRAGRRDRDPRLQDRRPRSLPAHPRPGSPARALPDRPLAHLRRGGTEYRLVWHYVAKNRTCVSTRTREDLARLRSETIARIDEIQGATEYPARKIALCNWCEYKERCPLWASPETLARFEAEDAAAAAAKASPSPATEAEDPDQLSLL